MLLKYLNSLVNVANRHLNAAFNGIITCDNFDKGMLGGRRKFIPIGRLHTIFTSASLDAMVQR